jgi:ATP-dependent RNA helicase DDX27
MQKNVVKQTLLFSATLDAKVVDLEKKALRNPLKVKLSHSAILSNLKQSYVRMKFKTSDSDEEIFEKRMSYLLFLVKNENKTRSIVFFNTKKDCHKAKIVMEKFQLRSKELNSNIPQPERLQNLNEFQLNHVEFLLATDIAARGIDIEKVKFVINFEFPSENSKYIHRIGRTARKGYFGEAITICVDNERTQMKKLAKKENFVLNSIKIDNGYVKKFYKQLQEFSEEINKQIEDDEVEMELQEAEKDIEKTLNITNYKSDIMNKPKK